MQTFHCTTVDVDLLGGTVEAEYYTATMWRPSVGDIVRLVAPSDTIAVATLTAVTDRSRLGVSIVRVRGTIVEVETASVPPPRAVSVHVVSAVEPGPLGRRIRVK